MHDLVEEIVVLAPKGTDYPYYATFGWIGAQGMPDDNSEWRQTKMLAEEDTQPETLREITTIGLPGYGVSQ